MAPPSIRSKGAQGLADSEAGIDSDDDNTNGNHNDSNTGNSNNVMTQTDGAAEETRHRNMVAMQMLDLGSSRREHITTTEAGPRRPQGSVVSQRSLLTNRRVNQEETPESDAFQKNKATIQGWNSYHTSVKDEDFEKLDSMMDGQSHRARLNETLQQVGGQRDYFGREAPGRSNVGTAPIPRGGSAVRGGRGEVTVGARGRGGRGGFQLPAARPIPVSGSGYRPLDPALEDDREYGYKSSRSANRSRRGADRPQVSVIGNTVRLGPTASNRQMARPLRGAQQPSLPARKAAPVKKPPPPPKRASPATHQSSKWDMLLDPAAFMKAISDIRDRETLNKEVPPAAASKTTDAAKREPVPKNAKKPSPEEQREQLRQIIEPVPRLTNVPRSEIRQVPTHEFMFPPPVVTTNQEANDAAYTDGVPSSESFCSAQTSQMQSPEPSAVQSSAPFVFEGNNEGPVVGLGIEGLPDSIETGGVSATQQGTPSGAALDLMDQDMGDFNQEALSPLSAEAPGRATATITTAEPPLFVEVNGIRYYREYALPTRSDREDAAASNSPRDAQSPTIDAPAPPVNDSLESANRDSNAFSQSRVLTNSGYSIGDLLGDHNLPGNHRVDSVVQTTPTLESRWATTSRATASPRCSRPAVTPAAAAPEQSRPTRTQASPVRRVRLTDTAASRSTPVAVPAPALTSSVASTVPVLIGAPANGPLVEGSGWHRLPRPAVEARSISASTSLSQSSQAQVQVPETVAVGDQNLPGRGRGDSAALASPNIDSMWSSPSMTEPANAQGATVGGVSVNPTVLGDHNLPGRGRSETSDSSAPKIQSKLASSVKSITKQLKALSPPSSVLPQRFNPFASSTSANAADSRANSRSRSSAAVSAGNLARSRWGDRTAVVQTWNNNSPEPINPFADTTASARQPVPTRAPTEPALNFGEPPRSNLATIRSPDLTMSGTGATVSPLNTTSIPQPPTETYQQRLVRAMNSNAAAGMTPFGDSQNVRSGRGRLRTLGNSPFRRRNVREQPTGLALMLQPGPTSPSRPLSENTTRANAKVASSASGTVKAAKDADSSSGESEL